MQNKARFFRIQKLFSQKLIFVTDHLFFHDDKNIYQNFNCRFRFCTMDYQLNSWWGEFMGPGQYNTGGPLSNDLYWITFWRTKLLWLKKFQCNKNFCGRIGLFLPSFLKSFIIQQWFFFLYFLVQTARVLQLVLCISVQSSLRGKNCLQIFCFDSISIWECVFLLYVCPFRNSDAVGGTFHPFACIFLYRTWNAKIVLFYMQYNK